MPYDPYPAERATGAPDPTLPAHLQPAAERAQATGSIDEAAANLAALAEGMAPPFTKKKKAGATEGGKPNPGTKPDKRLKTNAK